MTRVTLSHVSKHFGPTRAVADLNFTVDDGQFVVLLGPAGAGKTTTLRLIAGLETVSHGEVRLGERVINEVPPERRNVAMVFEDYALYPHLTVFDNLAFPLRAPTRLKRLTSDQIQARVREVASSLEMEKLLERLPWQLSGGQRQRVALGRALVRDPEVFLMDEPIAHLDAKLRHEMRTELKRIQKAAGVTTIYATPDYAEAMALADEIVVLRAGGVEQHASPEVVFNRPANRFVAQLVGEPLMNFFDMIMRLDGQKLRLFGEGIALDLPAAARPNLEVVNEGGQVVVGIRPADIRFAPAGVDGGVQARVTTSELRGSSTVYTLRLGESMVRVKVNFSRERRLQAGSLVSLEMPPDRLRFFDPADGRLVATGD